MREISQSLSVRESKILFLLAEGLSDREIAERLVLAYTTVKWYNQQIFNKLGVDNRRAAVVRARTLHLVGETRSRDNLPSQITPFVGRERETADLIRLLNDGMTRLITILAPGGMGKTRLALAVAEQYSQRFDVRFVPLAALNSPEYLVMTIAENIGLQFFPDTRTPEQQLLDYLGSKSMLLVLDNFEQVSDGAVLITKILKHTRQVQVLVTSRESLNVYGETNYPLGGMTDNGIQLFAECARRVCPDFSLDEDVMRICQLTQGMPLAIELAAAWMGILTPTEIADEVACNLDFLHTQARDVPERLRSIRVIFDATWERLTPGEQAVFAQLSVFRDGCTRDAAQIVAGANLEILTNLANKAVLWHRKGRYEVHELLRQYAGEKFSYVSDAHSNYYLGMLQRRKSDLEGHRQRDAIQEIERDLANVREGWLWAAKHGKYDAIDQSLHSLWLYYHLTGKYSEGETLLEKTAQILRSTSPESSVLGSILARRAYFAIQYHEYEKAKNLLEESEMFTADRAFLALTQGWLEATWKQSADANPYFEKALALYQQAGDLWGTGFALLGMGRSYTKRMDNESASVEAKRWLQEALVIEQTVGDTVHIARVQRGLGIVALSLRNYAEAERLMLISLEYNRQLDNHVRMAGDFDNLGHIARHKGNLEAARGYFEDGLAMQKEAGNLRAMGHVLIDIGWLDFYEGHFTQARVRIEEGIRLAEEGKDQYWMRGIQGLGWTAWAQGAYDEAKTCFQRLYDLNDEINPEYVIGLEAVNLAQGKRPAPPDGMHHDPTLQVWLGKLAYEAGDYQQARALLEAYLMDSRKITIFEFEESLEIARAWATLGDLDRVEGNFEAARLHLCEAAKVVNVAPILLMVLASAAELLLARSEYIRAVEWATVVCEHPQAYAIDKACAARLRDSLRTLVTGDAFEVAVENGRSLSLENAIGKI